MFLSLPDTVSRPITAKRVGLVVMLGLSLVMPLVSNAANTPGATVGAIRWDDVVQTGVVE